MIIYKRPVLLIKKGMLFFLTFLLSNLISQAASAGTGVAEDVTFALTVSDNEEPVITTNGNKVLRNEAGKGGARVDVSAAATCNCPVGKPTGVRSDGKALTAEYPVGTTTITWQVNDTQGKGAATVTQTVTVVDHEPPVITTNGDRTFTYRPGKCGVLFDAFALATDNCSVGMPSAVRSDGKPLNAEYFAGVTTITWSVKDGNGNPASTVRQTITVVDHELPVITTNGNKVLANEPGKRGASADLFALATDNCSVGQPVGVRSDGKALTAEYPVGTTTVTWQVKDANGNAAAPVTQTVTVTNTPPTLSQIKAPDDPIKIGTVVNFRVSFTDNNLHKATWQWGNGTSSDGIIDGTTVQGTHKYTTAGVYPVTVTLTDMCGIVASQIHHYVVVYDAAADFATGGGSINSPVGAYRADPTQADNANFGFVARFQKGAAAPSGTAEFQFQFAGLNFKSTGIQAGSGSQLKGSGKINGTGDYGFILTAVDGHVNGGSGMDKFRIRIWDKADAHIVYDNKPEAADTYDISTDITTSIARGAILTQRSGQTNREAVKPLLTADAFVLRNYPNPFETKTAIEFILPQGGDYSLHILDMKGSVIRSLQTGKAQPGVLNRVIWEVKESASGMYIGRLTTDQGVDSIELLVK